MISVRDPSGCSYTAEHSKVLQREPVQGMVPDTGVRKCVPDDKLAQYQTRHQEHGRVVDEKAECHVDHDFQCADRSDLRAGCIFRLPPYNCQKKAPLLKKEPFEKKISFLLIMHMH